MFPINNPEFNFLSNFSMLRSEPILSTDFKKIDDKQRFLTSRIMIIYFKQQFGFYL